VRVDMTCVYRLLGLALALAVGFSAQPAAATPLHSAANGIVTPSSGAVVRGVVPVTGVAQRADFAKWQLDLLPGGDGSRAVFLAVGETAAAAPSTLASFDSTPFADGAYTLRLRVVRRDGNYDEHFAAITIANRLPAPAQQPAGSSQARLVSNRAAALGLPLRSDDGQPILYLTFDDGPTPALTPQIVQVLDRYGAKATFFVVGQHVRRSPGPLRLVAEAGHAIENHTLTHRWLTGISQDVFNHELRSTEEAVRAAVGDLLPASHRFRFLRPTYGAVDASTGPFAAELGYQVVGWDLDPKDWRRPGAAAISSFVIQRAFPGAIVVLHDGGGANQQTVVAIETILEELSRQGYVFHALPSGSPLPSDPPLSSDPPLPEGEAVGVRGSPVNPTHSNIN
jgi:peptidoglycan-N-acetylglucosamine deacetylase